MNLLDDKLQEILNNADYNCSILNVEIDKNIQDNLLDYQILHVQNLIGALNNNNIAIDTSDTGCGKTYCALAICKQLNLEPINLSNLMLIDSKSKKPTRVGFKKNKKDVMMRFSKKSGDFING